MSSKIMKGRISTCYCLLLSRLYCEMYMAALWR